MSRFETPVKKLSLLTLLSALCVVLRLAFGILPNVQPITAIFLVLSWLLSLPEALIVMVVTMLVTSFYMGFGHWVFVQILAFTIIICLFKAIFVGYHFVLKRQVIVFETTAAFGLSFLYGVITDSIDAWFYHMPWWSYVAAGASFNLAHALSTLFFYPIIIIIFRRIIDVKIR